MTLESQDADDLPVRRRRSRRGGRHRSLHSVSLPPDSPALVLCVPGPASPGAAELSAAIATETAELTAAGDQGPAVRTVHLDGSQESLPQMVDEFGESTHPELPAAVLVPVLTGPHPHHDAELRAAATACGDAAVAVAAPLGPHPLLAAALHQRLAEAGLARPDRALLLSVVTSADGVIVATPGGAEAVEAAEATSVLLASRLAVPVVPAALDGAPSVEDAAARLRAAGASRLALAPYLIGPETGADRVDETATAIDAHRCEPLGAHPDMAKLVTQCYSAALDAALPPETDTPG